MHIQPYLNRQALIDRRLFEFGQVYTIPDTLIAIPDADRMKTARNRHNERWVVIASNNKENAHPMCPIVSVIPCSHRVDLLRPNDIELSSKTDSTKVDCIARVRLMQPILKVDLGKHQGIVSDSKKEELYAALVNYFGIDIE